MLESAFENFERSLEKIDVLVSNAAYLADMVLIKDSDDEDWWKSFEVNVKGTYNVIRAFLPHAAADAVLLCVNAGLATAPPPPRSPPPGLSGYISSKIDCAMYAGRTS